MHISGIEKVIGSKIIFTWNNNGRSKKYHINILILCINKTNEIICEYEQKQRQEKLREKIRLNEHEAEVKQLASEINFD